MTTRRNPIIYSDSVNISDYSPALDGLAALVGVETGRVTIEGAFKATDVRPITPNIGYYVGAFDDPGAQITPGRRAVGFAAVRVAGSGAWHSGFASVYKDGQGPFACLYVQSDANGTIAECVVSLTYDSTTA